MKTQNIVIIALLIIAGAAIVGVTSGLSLLGEDVVGPSCEVPVDGGDCELILQLEEGKSLADGYSFDLATETIADEEFKEERDAMLSASGGPYLEEDNMANTDYENTWVYTYITPTEWQNVFQYQITTTIQGASARTRNNGRAHLELYTGYVTIPYSYSTIEVETSDDGYNEDYALVSNYIGSDGEWYMATRHMALGAGDDIYVKGDSSSTPPYIRRDMVAIRTFGGSAIPEYNGKFAVRVEEDNRYYDADFQHDTPTMKVSWKEEYFITNLRVTLGGEEFFMVPGKVEGNVYLPDMAQTINEYCGRTGLFPDDKECVIRMKLSSTSGGTIIIVNELGELKEIGGDFNFNGITGWVTFDYENEPTNAYVTMGLILAVIGGLMFLILRGGKKK